jgi:hypothetical protein
MLSVVHQMQVEELLNKGGDLEDAGNIEAAVRWVGGLHRTTGTRSAQRKVTYAQQVALPRLHITLVPILTPCRLYQKALAQEPEHLELRQYIDVLCARLNAQARADKYAAKQEEYAQHLVSGRSVRARMCSRLMTPAGMLVHGMLCNLAVWMPRCLLWLTVAYTSHTETLPCMFDPLPIRQVNVTKLASGCWLLSSGSPL